MSRILYQIVSNIPLSPERLHVTGEVEPPQSVSMLRATVTSQALARDYVRSLAWTEPKSKHHWSVVPAGRLVAVDNEAARAAVEAYREARAEARRVDDRPMYT